MAPTTEARVITFLLGLLGSAFGAGVVGGVLHAELKQKADRASVVAYEAANTAQHRELTVQLEQIGKDVRMVRLISCDLATKDSFCRKP